MSRVLIELTKDVEDGNTGDPLWVAGQRLEVDPVSAKYYVKKGIAVLAVDVELQAGTDTTVDPDVVSTGGDDSARS